MRRADAPTEAKPEPRDADLVARVLRGERDAYQVLVRRYQTSLYRVAYAMVEDADVAEDLVQDAFVRSYVNLAACKNGERFRFWLLATLRNRALDHIKEKRRRDLSLSDDHVLRKAEAGSLAPADLGERLLLRGALGRALQRLSPALREAFVLRHVEEHSFEEIAELLDTGVSAVKMRVHRARQQLQEWLTVESPGTPQGVAAVEESSRGAGGTEVPVVTERRERSSMDQSRGPHSLPERQRRKP